MPDRILAEHFPDQPVRRVWMTTADVARVLGCSTRWVRWLVRQGELLADRTESGQHIFRRPEVHRVLIARTEAQARRRPQQLIAVRLRMLKAGFEPRQMSFLHKLKLVHRGRGSERALPEAEVKPSRSPANARESNTWRYVDRKVAGGRR